MTDQHDQALPRAKRRRLIAGAVLRALLSTTVLVVLYYLLPLDQPRDAATAARLLACLAVFAGVMVWQVRAVIGSRYPCMRAFEALG
jgi:voltage-gated potassium channel